MRVALVVLRELLTALHSLVLQTLGRSFSRDSYTACCTPTPITMSHLSDVDAPPSKWEVLTDAQDNMYFYNALTGESVWELPPEEDEDEVTDARDGGREDTSAELCVLAFDPTASSNTCQPRHKDDFSDFEIAIGVIDAMIAMLDKLEDGVSSINDQGSKRKSKPQKTRKFVSPAAEARFKKNQANIEKKKKRLREKLMATYLRIAIPPTSSNTNNEHEDGREPNTQASLQNTGLNNVGTLFNIEDTIRWRLEREVEQIKQRSVIRKEKQKHQKQVFSLKKQQEMLKNFRTELMRYFLSQIECSTELQQQRILLLSSPQQIAEMERKRKKSMEPELAERYAKEQQTARVDNLKNIQKVFVLIDAAAQGKLHLLQILFGIFTLE